jgi:hypothetical protein
MLDYLIFAAETGFVLARQLAVHLASRRQPVHTDTKANAKHPQSNEKKHPAHNAWKR